MTGTESVTKLTAGLIHILSRRTEMKMYEPVNGWGSWEGFCHFLTKLIIAAQDNPDEKWEACR